jgi:hypothetical protein
MKLSCRLQGAREFLLQASGFVCHKKIKSLFLMPRFALQSRAPFLVSSTHLVRAFAANLAEIIRWAGRISLGASLLEKPR